MKKTIKTLCAILATAFVVALVPQKDVQAATPKVTLTGKIDKSFTQYPGKYMDYWYYGYKKGEKDYSAKLKKGKDGIYDLTVYENSTISLGCKVSQKGYSCVAADVKGYVDAYGFDDRCTAVGFKVKLPKKDQLAQKPVKKTVCIQPQKTNSPWPTGTKTKLRVTILPLPNLDVEIRKMAAAEYNYKGDNYTKYDAIFTAFDYVTRHVDYMEDGKSLLPNEILIQEIAACESVSKLTKRMAEALGFPEKDLRVMIDHKQNHAWLEVRMDKKWQEFDMAQTIAAWKDNPYEWFTGGFGCYLNRDKVWIYEEDWGEVVDPNWRPDFTPGESVPDYKNWLKEYGLTDDSEWADADAAGAMHQVVPEW